MRFAHFYKANQAKRLNKAIALAGPRYTPKLNVAVTIASVFDGLGRTPAFYEALKRPANELLKNFRGINDAEIAQLAKPEFEELKDTALELTNLVLKVPNSGVSKIRFKRIGILAIKARRAASAGIHRIYQAEADARKKQAEEAAVSGKKKEPERLSSDEKYRNEKHYLYQVSGNLESLIQLSESNIARAANDPRVLLNGIAGSGKTHFLCDLARQRISNGFPTFIFLGEEVSTKDPLRSLKGLLNVSVSDKAFLSGLNKYAASKRTRLLIIVDAVNESLIKPDWRKLAKIRRYKNLAIALSVRSGFEQSDVPQSVLDNYVGVEHHGFAEHEWEAVTKFFSEYKLPLPEVPILFPEFRIPLFLRIFCESFSGAKQPIKGHYGFTRIFEQYVKRQGIAVLKRMGEVANLGASRARVWDGTIKEIALYMGDNGTDRIPESEAVFIASKQFPSAGTKALAFLEKAWLVTKVPRYDKLKVVGYDYRFPYQKFSDHLIVRNLLQKHLDTSAPRKSFGRGSKLNGLLQSDFANRGLVEAMAIQVPERLLGRELVYVTPPSFRLRELAKETFLESLVWRDLSLKDGRPKYINTRRVLAYLNKHIVPYRGGNDRVLETVLTVCAIPNHPLNGDLLHGHLKKRKMPERDAFWLPFINPRYTEEGAIRRLITWAWGVGDKTHISAESIRLAGITLAWLLASSNRFLRDRTTKALVGLFACRLLELKNLLEHFKTVDDPYILERLYAVAYGVALQPGNKNADLSDLALHVYDQVFKNRKPPTHFLLRDHARQVIELALTKDPALKAKLAVERIRPPYGSSLPARIPSLKYLRRRFYPKRKSYKHKESDYWAIWHSLMYNNEGGIADFGNYVVNSTIGHWCNLRLNPDGSRPKSTKELANEFSAGLTKSQAAIWQRLENMRNSLSMQRLFISLPFKEGSEPTKRPTETEVAQAVAVQETLEATFVGGLNRRLQQLYRNGVLPNREIPRGSDDLDYAAMQRLIFKRVVELGWMPQLFGQYDSSLREIGRNTRKTERIGKKYQWIAFHEILGRIADNYVFRGFWSDDFPPYEGPWQLTERDIDPSCLLRSSPINPNSGDAWWCRVDYRSWKPSVDHSSWTKITDDLPRIKRLLQTQARGGWLVLDGYFRWEQPPVPGQERFEKIRRDLWYIVRSYLIKRDVGDRIFSWAKQQDFMGRWMPDPLELHHIYLREIPKSVAYENQYGSTRQSWVPITDKQRNVTGFEVLPTTQEYNWEGSGFDCSVDDGLAIRMPATNIASAMRLLQSAKPGEFENERGEVVTIDPSVEESGPGVLLAKKKPFLKFLRENGFQLVWTVMGEKLLIGTTGGGPGFPGRLETGGAFRMKPDGKLEGATYTKHLPPSG